MERYADAEIGYVDAVVVAMAERLKDRRVATLDRRDFADRPSTRACTGTAPLAGRRACPAGLIQ